MVGVTSRFHSTPPDRGSERRHLLLSLAQRNEPGLQRGRQILVPILYELRTLTPARSLNSEVLFNAGRFDRSERRPLSLTFSGLRQKFTA